jgi:hypothetical protein
VIGKLRRIGRPHRGVGAAEFSNDSPAGVENLECHGRSCIAGEVVSNDCAVRRILPCRLFGREWSIRVFIAAEPVLSAGLEQRDIGPCCHCRHLTQRRDVVHDPEGATMGADYEIGFVHDEITYRSCRHVAAQRLPVGAIVEREVNGVLSSCVEQSFPHRIFPYCVHDIAGRNSVHYLGPCRPTIMRLVDVRTKIIQPQTIDCCVGGIVIEV